MIRALRLLFALALALLLSGMQLGAQLHALEHDGERLARPHGVALIIPTTDDVCAICASFAGAAPDHRFVANPFAESLVAVEFATLAGVAPVYYQSRAPPALL
ncbi:MAG: hypothetical protein E6H78_11855 [Betaproteobacteria bacterium]|nr:MAG: hypothetical protein E6H78_11855 [Betaproteobacteria bacterium]